MLARWVSQRRFCDSGKGRVNCARECYGCEWTAVSVERFPLFEIESRLTVKP